jgi:hypothetical protein
VGKITKEEIEIIKEYLLSFDEAVRNNIRTNISATLLKYITIIENGFLKDESIDKISIEIGLDLSSEELLKIRNEYFISLSNVALEGGSSSELEKINASNNLSFQKLLNEMADDKSFEKDMSIAMKLHQREEMKKRFKQIDEEDEFELSDKELKTAITSVERESIKKRFKAIDKAEERNKVFKLITRYAIAAAMVGVLIGGFYINSLNKEELTHNSIVARIEIPNLIESIESNKSIIVEESGRGFAKGPRAKNSITIQQNGLSKQIDTLQAMLEKLRIKDNNQADSIQTQIIGQIDSLEAILNTYIFNSSTKKAILNLPKVTVIENIISIDASNLSKFYINIQGKYYLIETNKKPVKLVPVVDKSLIENLQRIIFLND